MATVAPPGSIQLRAGLEARGGASPVRCNGCGAKEAGERRGDGGRRRRQAVYADAIHVCDPSRPTGPRNGRSPPGIEPVMVPVPMCKLIAALCVGPRYPDFEGFVDSERR
jgi:hypothetical protein